MKKLNSYSPSGKYSPISFIVLAVILCFVAPLFSFLYANFTFFNPYSIVNIGFLIGAVFLLTRILDGMVWYGKVRHDRFAFKSSVIITIWFYYLHWAVWTHQVVTSWARESVFFDFTPPESIFPSPFELASNPGMLWDLMMEINDNGSWGFDEWAISGFLLWVIWIIEFLVFFFIGIGYWSNPTDKPFSEETNQWLESTDSPLFSVIDLTAFKEAIRNNDPSFLDTLSRIVKGRQNHNIITLFTATRGQSYLSLSKYKASSGAEGSVKYETIEQMNHVAISKEFVTKLQEVFKIPMAENKNEEKIISPEVDNSNTVLPQPIEEKKVERNEKISNPITEDEEEITSPSIYIKVNENTSSGRILFSMFMIGIGVPLIYVATSMGDTHTEGLIFGVLLLVAGVVSLVKAASSKSPSIHAYALKVNPSFITIGATLVSSDHPIVIPARQLREVTSHRFEGSSLTLTIITHDKIFSGEDYLNLDIDMAKANPYEVENLLNDMAGKPVEERKTSIEDFLKKKPSLRA